MTQLLLFNVTNGVIIGAFYVLMAIGLSLILNLSNVINFAHGGFLVVGSYIAYTLEPYLGFWGVLIASPLVISWAYWKLGKWPRKGRQQELGRRPPVRYISERSGLAPCVLLFAVAIRRLLSNSIRPDAKVRCWPIFMFDPAMFRP